jgi:Spy/CpxP family protein refolding chaperone
MNIKLKTSLIIIFTLVVGIVIGALLNRALMQNRVQRVLSMRRPNVFTHSYLEIIKPNPDQTKQIREILERNGQVMEEIRSKSREDLESAMSAMMTELKSVLTPEQIRQLQDRSSRGRMPFGRPFPEDELTFLSSELELTAEQRSKLSKILEEFRMQPPNKMIPGRSEEMMPRYREKMGEREEAIRKILTDKQKVKYDELRSEHRRRPPEDFRNRPF